MTSFQAWSRKRPSPGSGWATVNGFLPIPLASRPDQNRLASLSSRICANRSVSGWVASLPVRVTKGLVMLPTLAGFGGPPRKRRIMERLSRWPPWTPTRARERLTTLGSKSGVDCFFIGLSAILSPSAFHVLHVNAAVNVDLLAGDVIPLRGQENHGAGNFFRFAKTTHRNPGNDLFADVLRNLSQHFGFGEARGNGVDGNVVLGHFQCKGFGKRDDAALAGRIVGLPEVAGLSDERRDVDDATVLLIHHDLQHFRTGGVNAAQVGIQDVVPIVVGKLLHGFVFGDAGVVHQNVYAAPLVLNLTNQAPCLRHL